MRVLATGTFDLLHPGHLAYLREARALGDELYVIVARDHCPEKNTVVPEEQRCAMVQGLKPVTEAVLGSRDDMYVPVKEIDPDIVALGPDQDWDEERIREGMRSRGIDADVVRIEKYEECSLSSSSDIVDRVRDLFC